MNTDNYRVVVLPPLHEIKENLALASQVVDLINTLYEVDIRKKGKKGDTSDARACAAYWLYRYLNLSYPKVAEMIGLVNHTSAMYAVEKWQRMLYLCEPKALQVDNEVNKFLRSLIYQP